mmetsp:Transcript_3943/g.8689  ORF Transcript_3943/g.8689 Transcript_3943/m.8689 type:complete len:87 (+) Transcript_3943:73-333(+)
MVLPMRRQGRYTFLAAVSIVPEVKGLMLLISCSSNTNQPIEVNDGKQNHRFDTVKRLTTTMFFQRSHCSLQNAPNLFYHGTEILHR